MPELVVDPPEQACSCLFAENQTTQSQSLAPDPFLPRARDERGRFARGHSGNPRGRPLGIPNPKRRIPDLVARPLSPPALSALLDKKPDLLRPLANQLLPPPLPRPSPAELLGIDPASLHRPEDFRQALAAALKAASRGRITPTEAARFARQVRARMRQVRRLARLQRRLARMTARLTAGAGSR